MVPGRSDIVSAPHYGDHTMQQSHRPLSSLTRHYVQSSLASGVLLALSRCRRHGLLKEDDRRVLRNAVAFFEELKGGEALRSGSEFSPKLLEGGVALEEMLPTMPKEVAQDIRGYLEALRLFIEVLLDNPKESAGDPRFSQLHDFMEAYSRLQSSLISETFEASHTSGSGMPVG